MAVKASGSITVAKERDISSATRFYRIASSSSTPSQPSGTADPSGWSKTEPSYDGTSTNSLYITDRTIFSDGTASWSPVSKSSSYEAAKQAYNEAQNAKRSATDYLQTLSGGVWVTPSDKKPDANGNAIARTRGVRITDVIDIYRGTDSVAQFGDEVRVGQEEAGKTRTILSENGMQVKRRAAVSSDVLIAHIGYGEGAAASGVLANPYYIFGFTSGSSTPGNYSFNTGFANKAEGYLSRAHGMDCEVTGGECGTASGLYLKTEKALQTVIGVANAVDTTTGKRSVPITSTLEDDMGKYAFIIGNGTLRSAPAYIHDESDLLRSNAFTVDWDGNVIGQGMAGMIQMFAGPSAPEGWLICDGSAISRTEYETLYSVIGTRWGAGDGSTTFNIPDLRGRAPIGAGQGSGLTNRALAAKVGSESLGAHTHSVGRAIGLSTGSWTGETYSGSLSGTGAKLAHTTGSGTVSTITATGSAGAGPSGANMQPSIAVNFIICTGKTD